VEPVEHQIEYMPLAVDHLRNITTSDQRQIIDAIENQLKHQPDVTTRNRKPLRPNDLATWELRIGRFRVFYDIFCSEIEITQAGEPQQEATPIVSILAVGVKKGNRLVIGDKEIEL
jgi:mRNA-degrading endonuclease RelE of RelBE toxin-antitoxin system